MSGMNEARLVISAIDNSSKALASIEGHVKGLQNSLKGIGPASAEVGKVSAALGNVGKAGQELDAVSKALNRAAEATPGLARQSEALGRAMTASAGKVRELEAEAQRLAQASGKVDLFKSMQGGLGKARAGFAEAKAGVEELARGIERADRNAVKLRADLAAAKIASDGAQAVKTAARPGRADAADPAVFKAKQDAHAEATRQHAEAVAEESRIRAALTAAEAERGTMAKRLAPAQAEVSRAAATLDREKAAVIGLKREIEDLSGGAMTSLSGVEGRIKAQAEGVATALDKQAAATRHAAESGRALLAEDQARAAHEKAAHRVEHGQEHHGFKNYALTTAAMAVSAHEIMGGIEATLEHGAEYQHRLVALRNAGRTPEEIAEMNEASHAALRGVPNATLTGNLEILNETVGAFGSVDHAIEHLGFMNKAATTLHAVAGDKIGGSAGEMGNQLARFFEMRGTAGNGEVFESEASQMMKSMIFSGGNVNPRELLNFAQQAKSSLQNYEAHDGFRGDVLAPGWGLRCRPGRGLRSRLSLVWLIRRGVFFLLSIVPWHRPN